MSNTTLLSTRALEILKSRGDDAPLNNGYRSISNTSYMSVDSVDSQTTVLLPETFTSVETLQFLGLRSETAHKVYDQFLRRREQHPDRAHILKSAKDYVMSVPGNAVYDNDEEWNAMFDRIGLNESFKKRIMDPEYKHMRLMGSLKHWTLEMMDMRFEFLRDLDLEIIETESGKRPRRKSSRLAEEKSQFEDCTWFYKGGALCRLNKIFGHEKLNMEGEILSTTPNDFHRNSRALYLSKHHWVAWEYAQWAKRVGDDGSVVPVGILRIAIPNVLLSSIVEVVGDVWRQKVWQERRSDEDMSAEIEHLESFSWLVGPICSKSNEQILGMKDKTELEILKKGQNTASQHATDHKVMLRQLNKACFGKVFIDEVMAEVKAAGKK